MNYLDYRERLGIGFNDTQKVEFFSNNIYSLIQLLSDDYSLGEYSTFCLNYGHKLENGFQNSINKRLQSLISKNSNNLQELLVICVSLINSINNERRRTKYKVILKDRVIEQMNKAKILHEIYEDADGYFIFPKGAEELDKPLVSEVLTWLDGYPSTQKTYSNALKQYADGAIPHDVADNLRKALEGFFQDFFGNTKNLANNKDVVGQFLKAEGADSNLTNMLMTLLAHYDTLNNVTAKHHDNIDAKYLEFLLYQTGIFIRMLITIKSASVLC